MDEANSPYLGELYIVDNFVQRDLSIPLPPPEGKAFRHLILTGRNGCGKSATLNGLKDSRHAYVSRKRYADTNEWLNNVKRSTPTCFDSRLFRGFTTVWHPIVHFPSRRSITFHSPAGPTRHVDLEQAGNLEQILINWRTQVAYAVEGNKSLVADDFRGRLALFQENLQELLTPTPPLTSFCS